MSIDFYTSIYKPSGELKGAILLVHGMCEHRKRYDSFAKTLAKNGYGVLTFDLLGHGETGKDNLGYFAKKDGWLAQVDYTLKMVLEAKKIFSQEKIIIMGHSMGSIIVRSLLKRNPEHIKKIILSGPPYFQKRLVFAKYLLGILSTFKGTYKSKFLNETLNREFSKNLNEDEKGYDWISFNNKNVEEYIKDDLCGFYFSNRALYDLIWGICDIHEGKQEDSNKEILIIAGDNDLVTGLDKGLNVTIEDLNKMGYKNITKKVYERARHEVLFEDVKDGVIKDILTFINKDSQY